jgi:hypothetical protein
MLVPKYEWEHGAGKFKLQLKNEQGDFNIKAEVEDAPPNRTAYFILWTGTDDTMAVFISGHARNLIVAKAVCECVIDAIL